MYDSYVFYDRSNFVATPIAGLLEGCRLFIEAPGFDTDSDSIMKWISWSRLYRADAQCLNFIYRNLDPDVSSTELQTRFDLAIKGRPCMVKRAFLPTCAFLQFLGLRASDARLATLRSTTNNYSILHYVASVLGAWGHENNLAQDWLNLGMQVLKNAADPWSLLAAGKTGETPLSSGLDDYNPGHYVPHQNLEELRRKLQYMYLWARMVDQSGVDLGRYGVQEAEAWHSRPIKLLYGPSPTDWSLEYCWHYDDMETFELQDPPGSYPRARDERVPTKICWEPSTEEQEEGMWAKLEDTCVTSQPRSLEDGISRLEELQEEVFPELIQRLDNSQDDAGAIALLQLRSSRWKRSVARRRSHSQPCPVSRWRKGRTYPREDVRFWLAGCHLCYSDYQWKLGYSCDASRYPEPTACFQRNESIKISPGSVQESGNWLHSSFLANISRCQVYHLHRYLPSDMKLSGHTGRVDCPWKCSTVKLDQLHVPAELWYYHPEGA